MVKCADCGKEIPEDETVYCDMCGAPLCKDKSNNYVVIKIKKGSETSDEVVGQLARYIGWVKQNLAKSKNVIGIIIAGGYNEKLRYTIKAIPNSSLATYEMDFQIKLLK